jgi:hypothetical protein
MNADPRMAHWHTLTREQQAETIHRMHAGGMSESSIAVATELSVEFIARVLGERGQRHG